MDERYFISITDSERKATLGVGLVHLYKGDGKPSKKGAYGFIQFYRSIACIEDLNAYSLPCISFSSHLWVRFQALAIQLRVRLCENNQPLKIYQDEKSCCIAASDQILPSCCAPAKLELEIANAGIQARFRRKHFQV